MSTRTEVVVDPNLRLGGLSLQRLQSLTRLVRAPLNELKEPRKRPKADDARLGV